MKTMRNRSVRPLDVLALSLVLLACEPPSPAVAPAAAGGGPPTRSEPEQTSAAKVPSCGAAWCAVAGIPKQVTFSAIWGSSPTDVWVAGEAGALLHYDGASWSVAVSGTESGLRALSGTSAKDVWAAGLDGTLLHFDGSSWSANQKSGAPWSPAAGLNQRPIYALLALPGQLWAGGSGTRSFDGKTWTEPHHGSHLPTMALGAVGSTSLWEVGLQGMLNRWDGHHWQRLGGELGPNFFGVWGSSPTDVWFVGSAGATAHWNGETPAAVPTGTTNDLHAVHGFGSADVWAVGDQGTILHWQGSAWTPSSSPTTSGLLGIWAANAHDVWIVGESGTVLRRGA